MERKYNNRANGQMETESVKRIGIYTEAMDKCTISKETACLIGCADLIDKLFDEIRKAYVKMSSNDVVAYGANSTTEEENKLKIGYRVLYHINKARYALLYDIGAYIEESIITKDFENL